MDRVKLGRALGYGTRHAAKTLAAVADAATTPDPRRSAATVQPQSAGTASQSAGAASRSAAQGAAAVSSAVPARKIPSKTQVRGASRSLWTPLATFSSALWLRVTGVFFALIAVVMVNGAVRLRHVLQGAGNTSANRVDDLHHFWMFVALAVLFGYFAVTGFQRANQRERRAAR